MIALNVCEVQRSYITFLSFLKPSPNKDTLYRWPFIYDPRIQNQEKLHVNIKIFHQGSLQKNSPP